MAIYTTAIGKLLNALHALSNFKEDLKAELMKSISKCDGDIQCISNTIFPFLQINVQDQIKAAVESIYYEAKYLEKPQGYHPIHIFPPSIYIPLPMLVKLFPEFNKEDIILEGIYTDILLHIRESVILPHEGISTFIRDKDIIELLRTAISPENFKAVMEEISNRVKHNILQELESFMSTKCKLISMQDGKLSAVCDSTKIDVEVEESKEYEGVLLIVSKYKR